MTLHDGDGWVDCRCGQRHWGRHGAAGLLLARHRAVPATAPAGPATRPDRSRAAPRWEVLLQLRAPWTHQGGTWALPGGARDSHEGAVAAALREADEEAGVPAAGLVVLGEHPGVEHVDWSYTYVLALARSPLVARPRTTESAALRWLPVADVAALPLHPAFATAWPALCRALVTRAAGTRGVPTGPPSRGAGRPGRRPPPPSR